MGSASLMDSAEAAMVGAVAKTATISEGGFEGESVSFVDGAEVGMVGVATMTMSLLVTAVGSGRRGSGKENGEAGHDGAGEGGRERAETDGEDGDGEG